jgi:hypothetical protein
MTKTIHTAIGVLALILGVMVAGHPAGFGAAGVVQAQTARVATLKGVIKSIDDASAVVVPNENKKAEVTFKVTPETTRTGAVAAGEEVTVSYRFEQTQRVATALTGKAK